MTAGPGKPRLLDLFCGAGGCAVGYHRAGFEVVGVDHQPMPRFPFEFHQADALEFCREHGHEFDMIHASPPCQRYSKTQRIWNRDYVDLLPATRNALIESGRKCVLENVEEAPMFHAITLCGRMFGLRVYRHRKFECSHWLHVPHHPKHKEKVIATGRPVVMGQMMTVAGHFVNIAAARHAMGIDWMTKNELSQAIPPAYTEFIGRQLIEVLQ